MVELLVDPLSKDQVTAANVRTVAKQYFSHWKTKYKQQVSPAEDAKRVQKAKDGRLRDRRNTKCQRRQAQATEFDKVNNNHTKATVRYVQAAFQSPEHSDCGEADRADWEAERVKKNGGSAGWETRKVLFRATWVSRQPAPYGSFKLTFDLVVAAILRTRQTV